MPRCTISARSSAARCGAPARSSPSHRVELELAADLPMLDARCRAVRAGAVQPARQRGQVCARRTRRSASRSWRDDGSCQPADPRRRRGHSAGRPRAHLRQVLSRAEGRPACAPAPASALRSRAASSRPCTARSSPPTAPTARGAVFTITLPIPAARRAAGHRRMSAAPLKVLVIDDEPPIRKLLRMGLSTQGYEILEAPNGKTALELLARSPDLVILDLGLPDIQGLELLRTIRARNDSVPIVVLSSRGDEAGKVAGARSRRRRLRHQAVRHGRAAGAHARGAAPPAAGAGRAAGLPRRRSLGRSRAPHRQGRRQGGEALAQGIRPAARAGAARRQGADPQVPAAASCGTS